MKTAFFILTLVALVVAVFYFANTRLQASFLEDQIAASRIITEKAIESNSAQDCADAIFYIQSYPQKIKFDNSFSQIQKQAQWSFEQLCERRLRDLTNDRSTEISKLLEITCSKDVRDTLLRRKADSLKADRVGPIK